MSKRDRTCDLCGEAFVVDREGVTRPWILLNRYGVGSGKSAVLCEGRDAKDVYAWDRGARWCATGPLLCFPGCLHSWIEMKMLEGDVLRRQNKK